MQRPFVIRDARPTDEPALAALEPTSPEGGDLAVQSRLRVGHLELAARFPGARGFVALAPAAERIVGVLFSSVAPTQFNGAVVPGAFLFSLRVHPAVRRRGIGSALIEHAVESARREAGAEVAWAMITAGNQASLRTFARAGFAATRDLRLRLQLPSFRGPRGNPTLALLPATERDLPVLADALDRANARHNFWRPCTQADLTTQLVAAGHDLGDVTLVVDRSDRILAAAAVLDVRRVFGLRFLGHRRLPVGLNRLFAPLVARLPLHPLLVRHRALTTAQPEAGLLLLRSIQGRQAAPLPVLAVPVDPIDPAWPLIARATQLGRPLHVVVKSNVPPDERRPMSIT